MFRNECKDFDWWIMTLTTLNDSREDDAFRVLLVAWLVIGAPHRPVRISPHPLKPCGCVAVPPREARNVSAFNVNPFQGFDTSLCNARSRKSNSPWDQTSTKAIHPSSSFNTRFSPNRPPHRLNMPLQTISALHQKSHLVSRPHHFPASSTPPSTVQDLPPVK